MPYTNDSTIVCCAADKLIKVFDINYEKDIKYSSTSAKLTCRCHTKRAKKIAPLSSHTFLSCSEDSTIRLTDLRENHFCSSSHRKPLFDYQTISQDLTALSVNPFDPHYILVGGENRHVFLSDLRMAKNSDSSTYISKFSIHSFDGRPNDTITAVRFSKHKRTEFLASWSGERIYLFDIHREVHSSQANDSDSSDSIISDTHPWGTNYGEGFIDYDEDERSDNEVHYNSSFATDDPDASRENEMTEQFDYICPIKSYQGHCNIQTVKDVNFYGPQDEYIMSGSDDGKLFIWDKLKGNVVQILTCDTEIVNCMEGHPFDPAIAVSGIDDSVKIIAPASNLEMCKMSLSDTFMEPDPFMRPSLEGNPEVIKYYSPESHMPNVKRICLKNERNRKLGHHHITRFDLGALLMGLYGYTGTLSEDAQSEGSDPPDPTDSPDQPPVRNYVITYGFPRSVWPNSGASLSSGRSNDDDSDQEDAADSDNSDSFQFSPI
jgi:hypothetical protein